MSGDEGRKWRCLARHLPEIYALEAGEPASSAVKVLIPSPLQSYTGAAHGNA